MGEDAWGTGAGDEEAADPSTLKHGRRESQLVGQAIEQQYLRAQTWTCMQMEWKPVHDTKNPETRVLSLCESSQIGLGSDGQRLARTHV